MAAVSSGIDICAGACVLLAQDPIQSFTGGDKETACNILYKTVSQHLLTVHPWGFNTTKVQLARLATAPVNQFKYAFKLPPDRIAEPLGYYNSADEDAKPFQDFKFQGDAVLCSETAVWCDYQFDCPVAKWPAYFVNLAINAMAAVLALPLTDDQSKFETYDRIAFGTPQENRVGGLMGQAMALAGFRQANVELPDSAFVLITCRQ